jgi:methyl-accepting chemotaxis protein
MQWMARGTSSKLLLQLTLRFLVVAVAPLLVAMVPTYFGARAALTDQVHEKLAAKASSRNALLVEYMHVLGRRGNLRAATVQVAEAVQALDQYAQATTTADGFDVQSPAYNAVYDKVHARMIQVAQAEEFSDVYLVSAESGLVWFNYSREADLGTNLRTGPYKNTGFAKAFERAVAKGETAFSDFEWFEPAKKACMFVVSPVYDSKGAVKAVTVVELDNTSIEAVIKDRTGLGDSGETYVVGRDQVMRTQSHLSSAPTVLKTKVNTEAARAGLAGKTGLVHSTDYRGVEVVSHYSPLGLQAKTGIDWVLIVEVDIKEVFAAIDDLGRNMVLIGLLAVLVMVGFSYWLSLKLSVPLSAMAYAVGRVAEGDLAVRIEISGNDEVAQIALAIQEMVARLRQQASAIGSNTATISAATTQLTTSMAELASSVTETASAVAETGATTEEVKQTSLLASQKAQGVAENARRAVSVAADSQAATDKTLADLARLQDQINAIAARMYRLSEQTNSVTAVVGVVDDISDQANLLAVNAAIEAAKAGEFGRGFAVVAQEIRQLAERTRRATTEIPAILGEIERAASAAVSATEVGTRSIEAVITQSVAAGQLVRDLSVILGEAAQSATQILVSGQQQLVGMNQVASAMESIRIASAQNADSAHTMQDTTRSLEGVGKDMQSIVDWYKI